MHPDAGAPRADTPSHRGRWWLAGALGLLLLFIAVAVQKVWSADIWWQIKNGEWILAHRAVPTQEMYSHTARGTPLREMRWLYCILVDLAWTGAGAWLLVLMQCAAVATIWGLLIWPVRRVMLTPLGIAIVALGLFAGFARWVVRPEMITYLMTAAFLVMLDRGRRQPAWRGLWAVPLLQILWVNGHTTFLFGPILAWTFAGADVVSCFFARRGARGSPPPALLSPRLFAVAALTTAARWVNPYGHWGAMYAVQMYRETSAEHATARLISEMRSPFAIPLAAWGWDFYAAACLIAFGALTFIPLGKRIPIIRIVVFAFGVYLFVMLQRNTALAAIMCAWAALGNAADMLGAEPWRERLRRAAPMHAVLGVLAAWLAWDIATDRYAARFDLPREFGFGVVEWYQPRGAERFLLDEKPQGNLFNVMRDGSYFVLRVSDTLPVYIDGRTDAYGPAMLDELGTVSASNFEKLAAEREINTAVLPTRGYDDIIARLSHSPAWALVHIDAVSVVFLRRTPTNDPIIARCVVKPAEWKPGAAEPDETAPAWKRAFGGITRPWHSTGMADALIVLGADGAAAPYLERAGTSGHAPARVRIPLAAARLAEGRSAEAERLLGGLDRRARAAAYREGARLAMNAGRLREAVPMLRTVVELEPEDWQIVLVLADTYFQVGDFASARDRYRALLSAGKGGASEWAKLGAACEKLGDREGAAAAQRNLERLRATKK